MSGDGNRNATVDVSCQRRASGSVARRVAAAAWAAEKIFRAPYTVPDRFAGISISIPTPHEESLTMKDPEVSGRRCSW
jgi:hypothetical protein